MINTRKIKGRMTELGLTQENVAKSVGIHPSTLNKKLNYPDKYNFTVNEVYKLANTLSIGDSDIASYFFAKELA